MYLTLSSLYLQPKRLAMKCQTEGSTKSVIHLGKLVSSYNVLKLCGLYVIGAFKTCSWQCGTLVQMDMNGLPCEDESWRSYIC